jgi:hypothetical protein
MSFFNHELTYKCHKGVVVYAQLGYIYKCHKGVVVYAQLGYINKFCFVFGWQMNIREIRWTTIGTWKYNQDETWRMGIYVFILIQQLVKMNN